jgi:hypothetical protein
VDERHTAALVAANDADELAARGNVAAAVEMYAAQGNWERAHELVSGRPRGARPRGVCLGLLGWAHPSTQKRLRGQGWSLTC